jgi:hypothetical protein
MAVLIKPPVLFFSASVPCATLSKPSVLLEIASLPTAFVIATRVRYERIKTDRCVGMTGGTVYDICERMII